MDCLMLKRYGRCSDACKAAGISCGQPSSVERWKKNVYIRSAVETAVIMGLLVWAAMA